MFDVLHEYVLLDNERLMTSLTQTESYQECKYILHKICKMNNSGGL